MPVPAGATPDDSLRLSELLCALSMASDYAMGQPAEHAMLSCRLALRIAEEAGADAATLSDVYYQALLRFIGCNADTWLMAALVGDEIALRTAMAPIDGGDARRVMRVMVRAFASAGGGGFGPRATAVLRGLASLPRFANEFFPGHCEVAQRLATRLGLPATLVDGLGQLYARWDGRGSPAVAGEAIRLPVRIVMLAQDLAMFARTDGHEAALAVARERRGRQYDPALVDRVLRFGPGLFDGLPGIPIADRAHVAGPGDPESGARDAAAGRLAELAAAEPGQPRRLHGTDIDDACRVLADYADIQSPWLLTHSERVARLSANAAQAAGRPPAAVTRLRRAALLHDIGRVGVSAGIWSRRTPLTERDRDRIRLHGYYTERILGRAPGLATLGRLASSAHERMDGGGYHRGACGDAIDEDARLLAAADAFAAMTEARPHRPALEPARAADELRAEVRAGRLAGAAVAAVLARAGLGTHASATGRNEPPLPAGLTPREAEVLGWLARGLTNKHIARRLGISPKTVDNQLQSVYAKACVRTRAGATLFAMEHGLVPAAAAID